MVTAGAVGGLFLRRVQDERAPRLQANLPSADAKDPDRRLLFFQPAAQQRLAVILHLKPGGRPPVRGACDDAHQRLLQKREKLVIHPHRHPLRLRTFNLANF